MKKRVLSIILTVLMAFAMTPITAVPAYAESYDLWVDGVQVTDDNCGSIITSDGAVTASFNPSTLTLTLENFNSSKGIYCGSYIGDLTINLRGTNRISVLSTRQGIYYNGNLVIQDDPSDEGIGELTVEAKDNIILRGISVTGDLTISKCKLTAKVYESNSSSCGIRVEHGSELVIEDGTVIATAGAANIESYGIAAFSQGEVRITIKGTSEVIASGYTEAITGPVINEISGKGWTDINGTEGEEKIDISDTARGLRNQNNEVFRKVHFKKLPLLTITAKDQTYEYDGEIHGPGDTVYDDAAEIAELVTVDGLQEGDSLYSIIVDGQGKDAGTYDLIPYGATVNGRPAYEKYDVAYVNGTLTIKDKPAPEPQPEPKPAPTPVKVSGTPVAKVTASGKTSLTIGWNKIEGADGYDIFFARCKHDEKKAACKNVKTIEGNDTFKWTKSGLRKGIPYKAYVKAYVMQDGVKKYVKTSPVMHAYTGNGTKRYTNAKSVSVNKTKVTLKQGKKFKIKAKVNKVKKGKTLMSTNHAPKLRYLTSDSSIAKVSKSGKITAKGKGTCYIYVYAHNGVYKKIKVTVK